MDWLLFSIGVLVGVLIHMGAITIRLWRAGSEERHQHDIERRLGITRTDDADPGAVNAPRWNSSKNWKH